MSLDLVHIHESYQAEPGEEYMNAAQLAHFEKILLDWKSAITEHNDTVKVRLQADTSPLADMNDRASLEEEFALELRDRDRERKLIKKINAALGRITSSEFGYCEQCSADIGIPRLEARPTAELCIDCKELAEKKEIRFKERT